MQSFPAQGVQSGVPTPGVPPSPGLMAAIAGAWVVILIIYVIAAIGLWKVFVKAGKPGWAAIVPVYNLWVIFEIIGRPGWWALVMLVVGFIPVVGALAILAAGIFIALELAKAFGQSQVFGIVGL